jgi:methionyl-tRNA formyltransferase
MRLAIIGRTRTLLKTAELLTGAGHELTFIWTARAEAYYEAPAEEFQSLAARLDLPCRVSARLDTDEARTLLAATHSDLAVSINFPGLIGPEILDLFPKGVLNAHAGDLPRYRGNAGANWAILHGEERVGLTVHQMAPELDAGPILVKEYLPLTPETYIGDIYAWLEQRIPEMFLEAVNGLADGALEPRPQPDDPRLALRVFPRRPEDGLINWAAPVESVMRAVRANSRPFAGAFTRLEGQHKIIVWRARPLEPGYAFCAVPGQVCLAEAGDPVIACRDGLLRLLEVGDDTGASEGEIKQRILSSLRHRLY